MTGAAIVCARSNKWIVIGGWYVLVIGGGGYEDGMVCNLRWISSLTVVQGKMGTKMGTKTALLST